MRQTRHHAGMGEAKRRQAARGELLDRVRSQDWAEHVQALYEEIAALSTALGMPTPRLRAAGLDPAGTGSLLASLQVMGGAVQQLQSLVVISDARTRALIDIVCRLSPSQAPMFRAMVETAVDLAAQEGDPDKRVPKPLIVH